MHTCRAVLLLQCVSNYCPGLLNLGVMLQPATDHLPFTQLSALRTLSLAGTSVAGVRTIATLTTLVHLNLCSTADVLVQYDWLLPLTAMRQLTQLNCTPYSRHTNSSEDGSDDDDEDELEGAYVVLYKRVSR